MQTDSLPTEPPNLNSLRLKKLAAEHFIEEIPRHSFTIGTVKISYSDDRIFFLCLNPDSAIAFTF